MLPITDPIYMFPSIILLLETCKWSFLSCVLQPKCLVTLNSMGEQKSMERHYCPLSKFSLSWMVFYMGNNANLYRECDRHRKAHRNDHRNDIAIF